MSKWPIGRHSKTRFFQNWILRNTYRHQPFDFYEIAEMRKTLVAELRKTWVSQKQNRAILWMIAQIVVFFVQNWCSKKEKFCFPFCKNCAKVLRMETLFGFLILLGPFPHNYDLFPLFFKNFKNLNLMIGFLKLLVCFLILDLFPLFSKN